ncbi:MAG: IS630 family transposase [Deinococcus sp.]|nr:IS630 family transposase [Deinococcus sp.]
MARAQWQAAVASLDPHALVFVDESGTPTAMTRTPARAPQGARAGGQVPRNRGKHLSLMAGLSSQGIQAEWVLEGAVDGDAFVVWLEPVLLPSLQPGQLVVLDNVGAHHRAEVPPWLERHHCRLRYLPSYAPDFNPIEHAFSKIKAVLKRLAARTKATLTHAIAQAIRTITPTDIQGWFQPCGYHLSYQ